MLLATKTEDAVEKFVRDPAHSVLIVGRVGSGKGSLAQYVAARVLRVETSELALSAHFQLILPENNIITIDKIRQIKNFLKLKTIGQQTIRRVLVIEKSELMTLEAQNSFLKMLEEPPDDTLIILTSAHPTNLLPTIISRVQTIRVQPLDQITLETYFTGFGNSKTDIITSYYMSDSILKIVLGSENEPKRIAVLKAFKKVFPEAGVRVLALQVESGISDHPTSASEALRGSINRIKYARKIKEGADYYVGIEGGLSEIDGKYWEHSFVSVEDKSGTLNSAVSAGLAIKGKILKNILEGGELKYALEEEYGLKDMGMKQGFYGLTTNNLITRDSATCDAVIFALAPFKNPKYFK